MHKSMKSGSWSNLRALSVNLRDKLEKNDKVDNTYVDDKSSSIGSADYTEPEQVWEETLKYRKKSYSQSAIAVHRKRNINPHTDINSAEHTPLSKRRSSIKRILGRKSTTSSLNTNSHPPPPAEKVEVPPKKTKTASKRDSLYFYLYTDALEKGLLSNEELDIWNIQARFPNDDLRLYEGIFTVDHDTPTSLLSVPSPNLLCPPVSIIADPIPRPDKEESSDSLDITRSPAVPRRMVTAKATIHPISMFRQNQQQNQVRIQLPPNIYTKLPGFQRLSPGLQAKFKKMAQRRQSAPSIVIRGVLGRSIKPPAAQAKDEIIAPHSPNVNSQRLSLKFGSHGATLNLSKRKYVMEGRVQLTAGMQTQDRYMFLFTDLLLIAKAKSGSNFKLKYRIRVCELWTAECLDDVCELPRSSDKSFVIGWPTTNFVATFGTPESKELWHNALLKKIQEEKEKETPKIITLKIINRDSSNVNHIKMIKVSHKDTAKKVVQNAVKEFNFEENENQYQLWVMSKKEGTAYPLIGHENPHAIQVNHVRDFISANGILPETDITTVAMYENMIEPEIRDKCHFILRNSHQSPKFSVDMTRKRISRIKAKTPSKNIFNWGRKRSGQRNESSDSGHVSGNSVGSEGTTFFSSSPPSTSPPATPKLFCLPLGQVCDNGVLPAPIATMLDILFRKGPYAPGVFRKCPSAKVTRQLKQKLDEEVEVDLEDESIHVVAALVKDFLRNIPDSVLDCNIYQKWKSAVRNSSESEKVKSVKRLLLSLDACNRVLVRRLVIVLNRIALRSDRNKMTPHNLAVCMAPSLLWPPGSSNRMDAPMNVAEVTEITEILQYFIESCYEIFDGITPTDMDWPPEIELKSDDEEECYEGDNEKMTVDEPVTPAPDDVTINRDYNDTANNKDDDDDDNDVTHFSRSRVTRRQFQRRKTNSRIDAARLMSLSQDSLDKVLMDVNLAPNRHAMDDIILNETELTGTHNIKKRGKGYMSNDSGFTTLSGEDEEQSALGANSPDQIGLPLSSSAGSNLNELADTLPEGLEFRGELRRLWAPDALNIHNGQILDDVELTGIEEEQDSSSFFRRQSQPAMHYRGKNHVSVDGTQKTRRPVIENGTRLVEAITSPMVEYIESYEEAEPFIRKPPTYARLKDSSSNDDRINNNYEKDSRAKQYLRQIRKQSTNDAEEHIAKAVTSSDVQKQYTSGVTVTVDDVRPPTSKQYRPVTLSIHGLNGTSSAFAPPQIAITSHDFKGVSSPANPTFFIGEEESSGSTPDALSSSQEDVFNGWSGSQKSYDGTQSRSKIDNVIRWEAPKTEPLSRKFKFSQTTPKFDPDASLTPENEFPPRLSTMCSIQKLTEDLQMMPDFRQKNSRNKSVSDEHSAFIGRKKASSVRSQGRSAASIPKHYIKSKSPLHFGSVKDDASTITINLTESKSSISDASKSSIESKTSNNETSPPSPKEGLFDRDVRSRRPYSRKRSQLSSKLTKNSGEINFSVSLPSSDWIAAKSNSIEKRESSKESIDSVDSSQRRDVIHNHRVREPSPKLNRRDISHMAGTVGSKIKELSNLCTKEEPPKYSPQNARRTRPGSVKNKITTFNHLSNTSSDGSNTPTENPAEKNRSRRKVGIITPPTKIESLNQRSSPTHTMDHLNIITRNNSNDHYRNGLEIKSSVADAKAISSNSARRNASPTLLITSPDENSCERSSQPVSDSLVFTLSDTFAFGNRKTPRIITPDDSPRNSPEFVRRKRGGTRSSTHEMRVAKNTSGGRTRHFSVDRYTGNSANPATNIRVAAWSVGRCSEENNNNKLPKRLEPPLTPSLAHKDKNANDLLPFLGIIQSEESYV